MILQIKLPNAQYEISMAGDCITLYSKQEGKTEKTAGKEVTSVMGYFGPFQLELAIKRIISAEMLNGDNTVGDIQMFLDRFKEIEERITSAATRWKLDIKEHRNATT